MPDDSLLAQLLRAPERTRSIQRCIKAQDAHSPTEQRVYEHLWKVGTQETADTKLVRIGLKELAEHSGVHQVNCRKNLLGLIEKQAVEIAAAHDAKQARATIYRVRSYKLILRLREQMGLTHVTKTSGIRFVDPATGKPLNGNGLRCANLLPGISPPGDSVPGKTSGDLSSGAESTRAGSESLPRSRHPASGNNSATPIRKEFEEFEKTPTTSFFERLEAIDPHIDRAAVEQIWTETHGIQPDATEEEIAFFFERQCSEVYLNKRVDNPRGLILSTIADWFQPRRILERRRRAGD